MSTVAVVTAERVLLLLEQSVSSVRLPRESFQVFTAVC